MFENTKNIELNLASSELAVKFFTWTIYIIAGTLVLLLRCLISIIESHMLLLRFYFVLDTIFCKTSFDTL